MRLKRLLTAGLLILAAGLVSGAGTANDAFDFDETGSEVRFVVRHGILSLLKGGFNEFSGTVRIDPAHPEDAHVEVTIMTASIDTGLSFVDGHLRSPVLFNVQEFPTMTFRSTGVDVTGSNTARVRGDLTLLEISHPVVLEATLGGLGEEPKNRPDTALFTVTGTVNRAAFGMDWGPSGFAEDVDIQVRVVAKRAPTDPTNADGPRL